MARGTLYCFTGMENVGVDDNGRLCNDDLITMDANEVTSDLYGHECEWSEDLDLNKEGESFAKSFANWLKQFRNVKAEFVDTDEDETRLKVAFMPGFAEDYFKSRYEEFKKKASEVSLNDFCTDMYSIKSLIENGYGDMVHTESNSYQTFDAFVRDLSKDSPEEFVLTSAVLLH